MLRETVPTGEEYWARTAKAIPDFPLEERRMAIALLRELAKGKPVGFEQLGSALGVTPAAAQAYLELPTVASFALRDREGSVTAFSGLSTVRTRHSFQVGDVQLWTWCATDTLFLPALLEQRAHVRSTDLENGAEVRLTVSPRSIEKAEPNGAVVSFPQLDADAVLASASNIVKTFCHFIFFFASRESGERWGEKHPGTFLLSLHEAMAWGARFNARNFGLRGNGTWEGQPL